MTRLVHARCWLLAGLVAGCAPTAAPGSHPAPPAQPTATPIATLAPVPTSTDARPQPGPAPRPEATGRYQPATPSEFTALAQSNAEFATALYAQLCARPGNLAFSPASISLALAMTYAGSRNETAQQMHQTLHFGSQSGDAIHRGFGDLLRGWAPRDKQPYTLRVANRLFGEQSLRFKDPFLATAADHYQAPLERLSFKTAPGPARKRINAWVEQQTDNKIVELLPAGSIDENAREGVRHQRTDTNA